jgi:hypothetical protein
VFETYIDGQVRGDTLYKNKLIICFLFGQYGQIRIHRHRTTA